MTLPLQERLKRAEATIARLKTPVSASTLQAALALRHKDDVYVPECKNGPTHTARHRRLDGWALLKTWSPITTIGYEIKVSRNDWRADQKYLDYLPLCHYLNIVAPKGIVDLNELPAGIGLLEPVGDGTRLIARRKAVWRDIELPGELFVYVLMCRAKIGAEYEPSKYRENSLRDWVADQSSRQTLAYAVNKKIRAVVELQAEQQRALLLKIQRLEQVEKRIRELGFDPETSIDTWAVGNKLKEVAGHVEPGTIKILHEAERRIASVRKFLEGVE